MKVIYLKIFCISLGAITCIVTNSQAAIAQNFANTPNHAEEDVGDDSPVNADNMEILMIPKKIGTSTDSTANLSENVIEAASTYTLGKEDVIEVTVQRHPEVSGDYIVNHEGKIQYQFVGDVLVAGLTKEQVKEKLQEILSTYIVAPEVAVKIIQYNSKVVYVYGEVGSPGKIFMRGDTITIREALIQAGLPLLSAANKKSQLITPSADGKAKKVKVNVEALLYEGDLRENLVMRPGDTLYIPATGLTKVMRAIQPVAAPIGTSAGTARTVTTGF